MKKLLVLNSSLNGTEGNSNQLASEIVTHLTEKFDLSVVERDLAKDALPHLTQEELGAWMTDATERTDQQAQLAKLSDELIQELIDADMVVIGLPMYNFGIPSVFKAWVDRIARAGTTFKYTETGPQGLLENKKVYIAAARGGIYQGTEKDSQTQHVKDIFALLGITDLEFLYAEGLNMPGAEDVKAAFSERVKSI